MKLSLSTFLFLSLSSGSASALQERTTSSSELVRLLLKASNRKNVDDETTQVVDEEAYSHENEGDDLLTCYYNLLSSSNYDSILSQSDFLNFVNLQSEGVGVTTSWGTTVTSFSQLSPYFVGVYNEYACGDAYVGCPSIEGIEIENVYDFEDGFLGRLCESMKVAVQEYRMELGLDGNDENEEDGSVKEDASLSGGDLVDGVPNVGYKPSEEEVRGFDGLGMEEESVGGSWKVPMLACASVVVFVTSLVFVAVRRSHGEDEQQLVYPDKDDDLFIGELMESDTGLHQVIRNRLSASNRTGDIEQASSTCSSSAPSNPFSDVISKSSSKSSNISTTSSSVGSPGTSNNEEFASMINSANSNPFSLRSVASSSLDGVSPNPTLTPRESPNVMIYEQNCGSSADSLDNYVKTKLNLDDYDDWLSTVAESEDEYSKSDVSSLSGDLALLKVSPHKSGLSDETPPLPTPKASNKSLEPVVPAEQDDNSTGRASASADFLKSSGDNTATLAAAVSVMSRTIDDSSLASSRATDFDGASSIEASTITSDITFMEAPRAYLMANIGSALTSMKSVSTSNKPRPVFEFAAIPKESDEEHSDQLDSDSLGEIKRDLASAIQAGDWTAVSATALLLAKADPASADSLGDMQSSVISNDMTFVTSQTERQRMSDLDNLVAVGDWKGVLVAVSQYEGASDAGSFAISILDEQPVSHTIQHSIEYGLESSGMDLRSEVESLVKSVVPEEIDHVDEMILQFSGREEELIGTLRTMQEKSIAQEQQGGILQHALLETDKEPMVTEDTIPR